MAKKRKKKQSGGLVAFLIVIAAVVVTGLALFMTGALKSGSLSLSGTKLSGAPETAVSTGEAAASSVPEADPGPTKDGDIISGTIYDPARGIDVYNYEARSDEPVTLGQDAGTAASSEGTIPEAAAESAEDTGDADGAVTAAAAGQSDEGSTEAAAATVYVTTSDVNIRSGPGTDSSVLGKSKIGAAWTKTGESGDWTQIDYNGQTAYIKSEFLSGEKPETPVWNLDDLDNERVDFGYSSANRDANNVPTDWEYYENRWGQFNVDWIQDISKNTIYLTMDEGFGNDNTIQILDTLKEKNVNVTFFLTKNFVDERPELVQRMLDEGHQLGNHTCTHPVMTTLSIDDQTSQIMTLHNLIKDQFGYEMSVFRYPQGVFSNQSLGLVNNLGYKVVFWSYAYGDYDENNQPPVDESLQKALGALHNGAIYLLHASSDTNTAFLGDFIDGARERGFEFGRYPLT